MLNTKKIKLDFMRTKTFIPVLLVLTHCMAVQVPEDYVTDLYYADQPKVMSLTPSTSMSWTTLSTPVKMKFNNPMDASTITINTADTTCSGSIQITTLAANFANCLQFSSLSAETRNSVITATLTADLDPNSDYIIKIAGTITDFRGKTLGADATYPFKSGVPSGMEPRIVSVTQANDWDFTVTFSRQMNTASFGTLIDGTCSGNVNLQETAGTCNNMWRTLTTGDNITYTITYKNPPPGNYAFTLKKEILDKFSIPLTADYTANLTH